MFTGTWKVLELAFVMVQAAGVAPTEAQLQTPSSCKLPPISAAIAAQAGAASTSVEEIDAELIDATTVPPAGAGIGRMSTPL